MRRSILVILVACSLMSPACSKDPHRLKITEQNKDSLMDEIKSSHGLTVEENRLLMAYMMRRALAKGLGSDGLSPVGKTVGEIINQQKQWESQQKAASEEQDRLAAEARAKENALVSELRKSLTLSVYEKSFLASDFEAGRVLDSIVIKCAYQNTSSKDIRAFEGTIVFRDLFGDVIANVDLKVSDPIKAGEKATWVGTTSYNEFLERDVKLRNTELKDMRLLSQKCVGVENLKMQ